MYRAAPGAANTGCRRAEKQLFVLIIPEFFAVSNETATKELTKIYGVVERPLRFPLSELCPTWTQKRKVTLSAHFMSSAVT